MSYVKTVYKFKTLADIRAGQGPGNETYLEYLLKKRNSLANCFKWRVVPVRQKRKNEECCMLLRDGENVE